MSSRHEGDAIAWCEPCGKWLYTSRKHARKRAADQAMHGVHAYRCPVQTELWHLGHIPQATKWGIMTADEVYGRRRPECGPR
jgi:hypothetical protein